MIADMKDREPSTATPFVIVNFSHHELTSPEGSLVIVPKKSAPGEPPRNRMCVD